MARITVCVVAVGVLCCVCPTRAQTPQASVSQTTPSNDTTRILRGRIVGADTGTPLRSARVQASTGARTVPPIFTDPEGRFAMGVPVAASPRLTITKPGYLLTTITTARADVDIDIRMPKAGAISGRVVDAFGDPVIGMTVTAALSRDPHKAVGTGQTNDLGDYRVSGLPGGVYVVSVNSVSPLVGPGGELVTAGNVQFVTRRADGRTVTSDALRQSVRVYYPGAGAVADAQPITLAPGEERSTIAFSAPSGAPIDIFGGLSASSAPGGRVPPNFTARIRGRVLAQDGRAVPQAMVQLQSEDYPSLIPAAVTNQDGQYEFRSLSAGIFRVIATKPGFVATIYGQRPPSDSDEPIELRSGETRAAIDITLPQPGAIAGRVADADGEPVEGASVHILQIRYRDGRRRLVEAGGQGEHRTDDRGAYRIYGLAPGEYIVGADVGQIVPGRPVLDLPGYATTYFPSASNPGDAQRIAVDLARDIAEVDVALVRASTARISGTLLDAAGQPGGGGLILTPSRRSGVLATDPVGARTYPDGRFEFSNVPSGEYVVQASRGRNNSYTEGEAVCQYVTVNGSDVTGLILRASRGSSLKGHVTYDGNPYPELYSALNLQAVPVDMDRTPQNFGGPASARIQPDGTFEMGGLSGPRVLRLTEAPRGWALKAVLLNGRDVTDAPLSFGSADQSIHDLEVVLTDRVSEVKGRALDAQGRGVPGATVVIFSTDRGQWNDASRFVAVSNRSDRDGAFSVRKVAPGDYYAVAVTSLSPGEWHAPDLLEALISSAVHLTLSEGDMVTVVLGVVTR